MQWHPIFAHLLRPMLESYYEVRIGQPVGDIPRESDIVLLRKTTTGPLPFHGLWSRLTPWNVLEYKGPTVSARFDDLHALLELGLGIYRRLNELQKKAHQPEMDYPDVSFWYLVNDMGQRFLADLPRRLLGVQKQAEGIWRAHVFEHPVFLVSVQDLKVEHDTLPLHVLAGVPDADRETMKAALKAEPALWPSYLGWLAAREPGIWQEIILMAAQQETPFTLEFGPLLDYLKQSGGLKGFLEDAGFKQVVETMGIKQAIEAVGVKQAVEAVGVKQTVEAVGLDQLCASLSLEQRQELLRRLTQATEPPTN